MRLYTSDSSGGRWADFTAPEVSAAVAGAQWFWLDVPAPTREEIEELGRTLDIPRYAIDDIIESTEIPKLHEYDNALFAISHTPGLATDRFSTHELDIYFTQRCLVTFHREHIPGIEWTIDGHPRGYDGPAELMTEVLAAGAHRYLTLIDGLGEQIEELEAMAIAGEPEVLGRVQALRRDAIVLRSLLAPERDTIRALSRTRLDMSVAVRRQLESIYDDYFRIVESLDTARALLASVLDTYRSTVAERTNEVMKVLTVFSAIFLPLALLAGIYGMNFANMPELSWRWGYLGLVVVMAVVGIGLWSYFAWRGFVGGPKLFRVDRVIGKGLGGLVHLTTAPIRGVYEILSGNDDDQRPPGDAS